MNGLKPLEPAKVFAMIPTYNEAENIGSLLEQITGLGLGLNAVVVDDNSPDGTHEIVAEKSATNPKIHLLLRKDERGRGSAGIAGFKKCLELGAEAVIEMDADFSHETKYIPMIIEAARDVDVVIASRLVKGGGEINRSLGRVTITKAANLLTRHVMGYPVHDCTSGYRLFRRSVLKEIELDTLEAEGPAIVGEVLYRVVRGGYRIREVPYIFQDRQFGTSSLTGGTLGNCLSWLMRLKWTQTTRDADQFAKARRFYKEQPLEPAEKPWSAHSS